MSLTMEPPQKPEISQKEYLKRYLSKERTDKKKKKKVKISSSSHLKRSIIIDDDLGLPNIASVEDEEFNLDYLGDEAPQIAGIIDERPAEIKAKESYGENKWRPVGESDGSDLIQKKLIEKESHINSNGKTQNVDRHKKGDISLSKSKTKSSNEESAFRKERKSSDSDLSPPRSKNKGDEKSLRITKKRISRDSDSDLSPPRSRNKYGGKGNILVKKRHSESSSRDRDKHRQNEASHSKHSYPKERDSSYSPHRGRDKIKKRVSIKEPNASKGSDSDLSPPRRSKVVRRIKYEEKTKSDRYRSDSDLSPPRKSKFDEKTKRRRSYYEEDHFQPRKSKNQEKQKRKGSDSDLSPPKKNKHERREQRKESDSDLSPPRRGKQERPRSEKRHKKGDRSLLSPPTRNKERTKENTKHMDKTLDGKKAGLQDAKNLKEELKKLKEAENAMFAKMRASVSGKSATAIMRDKKTGKIRDLNKEKEIESQKSVKVAERENKYAKWGKGLRQVEEAEEKLADYLHEINKPVARYAGDEDLERMLKAREREGDPMLDYIRNKQSESIDVDLKGKPQYQGYYLPNRFNIRPGHRWDGVDRSSGYEKQWFERQNAKKALQEEAYKWSTSDM